MVKFLEFTRSRCIALFHNTLAKISSIKSHHTIFSSFKTLLNIRKNLKHPPPAFFPPDRPLSSVPHPAASQKIPARRALNPKDLLRGFFGQPRPSP